MDVSRYKIKFAKDNLDWEPLPWQEKAFKGDYFTQVIKAPRQSGKTDFLFVDSLANLFSGNVKSQTLILRSRKSGNISKLWYWAHKALRKLNYFYDPFLAVDSTRGVINYNYNYLSVLDYNDLKNRNCSLSRQEFLFIDDVDCIPDSSLYDIQTLSVKAEILVVTTTDYNNALSY